MLSASKSMKSMSWLYTALLLMRTGDRVSDRNKLKCVLSGGDDYELLFCVPPLSHDKVLEAATRAQTRVTRIGCIDHELGVRVLDKRGDEMEETYGSFDHFG